MTGFQMNTEIDQLIEALKKPKNYPHSITRITLIETHISWVFLTGEYVYKIKKPINLGFLDFSSLEKRHQYCDLELALNKRLAPNYYLQVIPITGSYSQPVLNGKDCPIEYAVKMRQFPQQAQLDRMLAENKLNFHHMDLLAKKISEFHQQIQVANQNHSYGELTHIHTPVLNCFSDILNHLHNVKDIKRVNELKNWSEKKFLNLRNVFLQRKNQGFIRECHGDLHLRNIAITDEEVIAFDGIEFSEDIRWNDVMSEIAFLIMDLQDHGQTALASHFLNGYLESTGDYSGLLVMRYYLLYRAVVRAMISCIRLEQKNLSADDIKTEKENFQGYINLAENYTKQTKPKFFITHGLSGSGKSTTSEKVMQDFSAIRIRSDVERKRLCGINETTREGKGVQQGIYTQSTSEKTYLYLAGLAEMLLTAGFSVIVDAAFLRFEQRTIFFELAKKNKVNLTILTCDVELKTIRKRITKRSAEDTDVSDAGLDVLEYQINHLDPLTEQELHSTIKVSSLRDIPKAFEV